MDESPTPGEQCTSAPPETGNIALGPKLREKFALTTFLGRGGFGEVWGGTEVKSGTPIAVKIEKDTTMRTSFLSVEVSILKIIMSVGTNPPICGFPAVRFFGQDGPNVVMVQVRLGPSLDNLFAAYGPFSSKTVAMLGDQMISRLETMHMLGFIHRDIKPENFLMGVNKLSHHLYMIDFGLSGRFITEKGSHKEMLTKKDFLGTTRFASLHTHQGFSQSRRDDLEQLSYVLIYLYRGSLPWTNLKFRSEKEKEAGVGQIKEKMPPSLIAQKCPRQLEDLLVYAKSMEFTEAIDYSKCRRMLGEILVQARNTHDYMFDWRVLQARIKTKVLDGETQQSDAATKSNAVGVNSAQRTAGCISGSATSLGGA
jgi:casein kinase 1